MPETRAMLLQFGNYISRCRIVSSLHRMLAAKINFQALAPGVDERPLKKAACHLPRPQQQQMPLNICGLPALGPPSRGLTYLWARPPPPRGAGSAKLPGLVTSARAKCILPTCHLHPARCCSHRPGQTPAAPSRRCPPLMRSPSPVRSFVRCPCRFPGDWGPDVRDADMNPEVPVPDQRRIDVVANSVYLWHGSQLAVEATSLSALAQTGAPPRSKCPATARSHAGGSAKAPRHLPRTTPNSHRRSAAASLFSVLKAGADSGPKQLHSLCATGLQPFQRISVLRPRLPGCPSGLPSLPCLRNRHSPAPCSSGQAEPELHELLVISCEGAPCFPA